MQTLVEMPTPQELVSLSVNELCERKNQIMDQIYESLAQQKRTSELRKLYTIYQDEWLERLEIGVHKYRQGSKA